MQDTPCFIRPCIHLPASEAAARDSVLHLARSSSESQARCRDLIVSLACSPPALYTPAVRIVSVMVVLRGSNLALTVGCWFQDTVAKTVVL